MRGANFVAFFTVQGFFIGIVFALLKGAGPEGILTYTFLITAFFYLFSHLCIALYFRTISMNRSHFPKEHHEHELDLFIHEINKRESHVDRVVDMNMKALGGDAS
jgi:hypothetical protein